MKSNKKSKKSPAFEPFDRDGGLELFEEGFMCEEDFGEEDISLEELELDALEVLKEEVIENINDYQTIIDIELDSNNKDKESIKLTNQRIGQLTAELHAIKKQIRKLKKNEREGIAA